MKPLGRRLLCCILISLSPGLCPGQSVVVGITDPGSTSYPNGNLALMDTLPLPGDRTLRCILPDAAGGVVYTASDALPAAIHRRSLTGLENLQTLRLPVEADRVVGLVRLPDEPRLVALTSSVPARLATLAAQPLELESLITVPGATGQGRALAVDPRDGRFVVVSAGATNSTRVGLIDPATGSEVAFRVLPHASNELTTVLVDMVNDRYHIGLGGITARLFQLSTSDLSINHDIYIGNTSFSINRPILAESRLYAVRSNFPAQLVSLDAADYGNVTSHAFPAGTSSANGMAWDTMTGELVLGYLGSGQVRVGRFNPTDASLVVSRVLTDDTLVAQAISVESGSVLVGRAGGRAARLARLEGSALEITGTGQYQSLLGSSSAVVSDPEAGVRYLGISSSPAQILKLSTGSGEVTGEVVATNAGAQQVQRLALDKTRGELYALLGSAPASILRIGLSGFSETGWLSLTGVTASQAFAHDEVAGYIYTVANGIPSRIVRLSLSDFSTTTFATLGEGDTNVNGLVLDRSNGWLYAMTNTSPGRIARVRLSDFTHDRTLILGSDEAGLLLGMVDAAAATGYFASLGSPMRVARVRLTDFTHQGTLQFPTGENNMRSLAWDGSSDRVWFSMGTTLNQGNIVGMQQGAFIRDSGVPLLGARSFAGPLVADPSSSFITHYPQGMAAADRYHIAPNNQLHASRIEIAQGGWLTDLQIYSHTGGVPIRVGLYRNDNPKSLIIESPELTTVAAGTSTFPVTPMTIPLEPGSYWLAWQSPATGATIGRHPAGDNTGFSTAQPFGPFPNAIRPWEVRNTSSRWAQSLVYTLDLVPPVLETVTMTTSNASGSHARPGDSITFAMRSSKDLGRLAVTVGGVQQPASGVGRNWGQTRFLDGALPEGPIAFELLARDLVGNESTTGAVTSGNVIIFDSIPPSPFVLGPAWKVEDAIPLSVAANEPIVARNLYVWDPGSEKWHLVPDYDPVTGYTPTAKGLWSFGAQATDLAGNGSSAPLGLASPGVVRVLYNSPANSPFTHLIGPGAAVGPYLYPMTDFVVVRLRAELVTESGEVTISRLPSVPIPSSLNPSMLRLDALDIQMDSVLDGATIVLQLDADPLAEGIVAAEVTHVYTRMNTIWERLPARYDSATNSIEFSPVRSGRYYFGNSEAIRPSSNWHVH